MSCLYFCQNVPPDLSVCGFVLADCLSVRALQEMLTHSERSAAEVKLHWFLFSFFLFFVEITYIYIHQIYIVTVISPYNH